VTLLAILLLLLTSDTFVADASAEASYIVNISREALRGYVDDVGLFERNMPGVVGVTALGDESYLYRTEKDIPLKGAMRVDFHIRKFILSDTLTVYRSVDVNDKNYMSCRVALQPYDATRTSITISLRVRMERENPAEIHWLAPVLGEQFISDRMTEDIEVMLEEFIANSNRELYTRIPQTTTRN
jgi:hypothetical protein